MPRNLKHQASEFAHRLEYLFGECLSGAHEFEIVSGSDDAVRIGPRPFDPKIGGFSRIPLPRGGEQADSAQLSLRVEFHARLDSEREYMAVENSALGLWVQPDPVRRARPVFRIEYDRDAKNKPAAHVHLHAESSELAWVYGSSSQALPSMSEIHFPVGGRRFRPTVEEVLLFLHRERLYTDWKPGWERAVKKSLSEWEGRQLKAAVRRDPQSAAEELRELGWVVRSPAT